MTKLPKIFLALVLIGLSLYSCKKNKEEEETIIKGKTSLLVEESIHPIVEDAQTVFETQYNAKLTLVAKAEAEIINNLLNDSLKIAVIPRKLTIEEVESFNAKKIHPKMTHFASDAVVLITNNATNDTLIDIEGIIEILNGKNYKNYNGIVFDNLNSNATQLFMNLANIKEIPKEKVYSFNTTNEVINYVAKNNNMIGIIGLNWIVQPNLDMENTLKNIRILSLKNDQLNEYVFPSQDNLAQSKYPLARDLYIINCQGYDGLGMGFASFLAGERGQRIILKSGLLPVKFPSRNIVTRNKIINDKN